MDTVALTAVITVCWLVPSLVVFGIMISRSELQPLKARGCWLLVITGLSSIVLEVGFTIEILRPTSVLPNITDTQFCSVWRWLAAICYPSAVVPYALRAYRTSFVFSESEQRGSHGQYPVRKHWMRESHLLKMYLIIMTVVLSLRLCTSVLLAGPGGQHDAELISTGCDHKGILGSVMWFWAVEHTVETILLLVTIYLLWDVPYHFSLFDEFACIGVFWTITTAMAMLLACMKSFPGVEKNMMKYLPMGKGLDNTPTDSQYWFWNSVTDIPRFYCLFFVSCVWPLWQSYYSKPEQIVWSSCDALRSLRLLLNDVKCLEYFREFLIDNFNVEYLLCYTEIEIFKHITEHSSLSKARRIYDRFLTPDAEMRVEGVSVERLRKLRNRLESKHETKKTISNIFNNIQKEVFDVMNKDIFPRFLASDLCRELIHELEKSELLRETLVLSKMMKDKR